MAKDPVDALLEDNRKKRAQRKSYPVSSLLDRAAGILANETVQDALDDLRVIHQMLPDDEVGKVEIGNLLGIAARTTRNVKRRAADTAKESAADDTALAGGDIPPASTNE